MKRWRLGFLESRIARRVFGTFVLCALTPLAVHAWISTREIESQLTKQASQRLELETKTMAMSVVERLGAFAEQLVTFAADVSRSEGKLVELDAARPQSHQLRFAALATIDAQGTVVAQRGEPTAWPSLDDGERAHLERGEVLFCTRTDEHGETTPFLAVNLPRQVDAARALIGIPSRELLWRNMAFAPPETEIAVLDEGGEALYASARFERTALDLVRDALESASAGWLPSNDHDVGVFRTLFLRPQYRENLVVVLTQSHAAVLAPARGFRTASALSMALAFLLVFWLSFRQVRKSLVPVEALTSATARVARNDLDVRVTIPTGDEFEDLGAAFNDMTSNLARHARIESGLYQLGLALHSELGLERLIRATLDGALQVTQARAVCLFVARDDSLLELAGVRRRGERSEASSAPHAQLDIAARMHAATRAATGHATLSEEASGADLELSDELRLGASRLVCAPLHDHERRLLGVLQVALDDESSSDAASVVRLIESVGAQAALALTKNQLIEDFRNLVISITEVLALAIDEKSPHTGAHCHRVPEIMKLLTESASRADSGPLRDFRPTEEELYEIRVAALLHDCGKVVTPVHVIEKATKLQTIFDRVALVDMRFELLAREAEIERLRATIDGARTESEAAASRAALLEEREFLRRCNVPMERMPDADAERVKVLANSRTWRDLDGNEHPLLTEEEVENLTVRGGTLTAAERKIINDHIVVTIKMLEQLRYPKGLRNVPIIAGAHHERMDGRGYPRGLVREQIPWAGRMMALADVFEALTDSERPYKKALSLQESLEIMGRMATTGHLDPDVFELFVEDEVYLRYAREFLPAERVTPVDLTRVPGLSRNAARSAAA